MIKITIELGTIAEACDFLRARIEPAAPVPTPTEMTVEAPEVAAPTTRRGRKSRALPPVEVPAEESTAPAIEASTQAPEVVATPTPEPVAVAPNLDDVKAKASAKLTEVFEKLGFPEAQRLLMKVGAPRLRDVEDEKLPELIILADEMLKAAGK